MRPEFFKAFSATAYDEYTTKYPYASREERPVGSAFASGQV